MEREAVRSLPKLELHCHLDGSLDRACVSELLGREVSREELAVSEDCRSLAEYLEKFELPLRCLQTAEGLKKGSYDFMRQVAAENVRYIEVRFAPQFSAHGELTEAKVIAAVLAGLEAGRQELGVDYGVIVCAMRHLSVEENLKTLRAAREFWGNGVCAADLAGDEAAYPMRDFMGLFEEVKRLGMPFTLHAGECGSAANIADSVQCGAKRIGHGIAMRGDAKLQQLCREREIGIELCPISNLQTKAVPDAHSYPMREFLDAGLLVTLNTDNRTVSGTSAAKEIEFVQKQYGVTDEEIIQMQKNAVECAFASEEQKARMRKWFE